MSNFRFRLLTEFDQILAFSFDRLQCRISKFQSVDSLNLFNTTEEVEDQLINIHAPLGIPLLSPKANTSNYGLLINEGYIAGNFISN